MSITQERFNELIYWSLQLYIADRIESDDAMHAMATKLFCTRFNSMSHPSYQNLYHQFNQHTNTLASHYAERTGIILTNEMRLTLADYESVLCAQLVAFNDDDNEPLSMLKSIERESFLKTSQDYTEQEYVHSFNKFKHKIMGKLNVHFKSNFDYTCLGSEHPSLINHFLTVYSPELITAALVTIAAYHYDPIAPLSHLALVALPQTSIGMNASAMLIFGQFATQQLPVPLKAEYLFDPHRHVKIWLSEDQTIFLSPENQSRLIHMRTNNPKDVIHFAYAKQLLSKSALTELTRFCKKYSLTAVCIEDNVLPNLNTQHEKDLALLYQQQIDSLNLAIASEILRWLKPIFSLGTYSAFDVVINTAMLPPLKVIREPLLLNIGSCPSSLPTQETLVYKNDMLSIIDSLAAAKEIEYVQTKMLESNGCESAATLFAQQSTCRELDINVADYSYSSYSIFQSSKIIKMHATQLEIDASAIEADMPNNASWKKSGQKMSTLILQSLFKTRMKNIKNNSAPEHEHEPNNSLK